MKPVLCLQESSCAYVLIVTAVYWVSEAVPLGAAALVPAFLYPLFGVLKSSEVRKPLCALSQDRTEYYSVAELFDIHNQQDFALLLQLVYNI